MARGDNTTNFDKLEFWALTALFVFCLPMYMYGFSGVTIRYITVFLAVLYVDFKIMPHIGEREQVIKNILGVVAVMAVITGIYFITSSFTFDVVSAVALVIVGHLLVKQVALFIISKTEPLRSFFIIVSRDGLIVLGLWMIISYWILIIDVPTEIRLAWLAIVPNGVLLHGFAFHYFIPVSLKWRYPVIGYFLIVAVYCVVTSVATSILTMVMIEDEDRAFTIGAFSGIVNGIFTSPALWLIYRWQLKKREQIDALQSELGRSTASLDFLRSQINPHFLFNALNTIYGLAIQEKAERTSTSVEKLGEMMRFMLLENMQERISLKRELEYLDNYISLQKLRTDTNPAIVIQVDIPKEIDPVVRITPMLLIPFVENAFKHGISLREQSSIKISLELTGSTLYFDVHNSRHPKIENDPEKNRNGIGLVNVRQRLQHLYPERHELLTRETARDFFVHLRIELD